MKTPKDTEILDQDLLTTENTESTEKLCPCFLYFRVFPCFPWFIFSFL